MAPQTEEQKSAEKKKERADIIYKYGRGREDGAEVDTWEDPGFELYHRTDRFGFIHDARSPLVRQLEDRRTIDKEMERVEKWLKMCRNWGVYHNSDKVAYGFSFEGVVACLTARDKQNCTFLQYFYCFAVSKPHLQRHTG